MPQLLSEILIDDGLVSRQKSFSVQGPVTGVNGESLLPVGEGQDEGRFCEDFMIPSPRPSPGGRGGPAPCIGKKLF